MIFAVVQKILPLWAVSLSFIVIGLLMFVTLILGNMEKTESIRNHALTLSFLAFAMMFMMSGVFAFYDFSGSEMIAANVVCLFTILICYILFEWEWVNNKF
jgi:hypothetical protein